MSWNGFQPHVPHSKLQSTYKPPTTLQCIISCKQILLKVNGWRKLFFNIYGEKVGKHGSETERQRERATYKVEK